MNALPPLAELVTAVRELTDTLRDPALSVLRHVVSADALLTVSQAARLLPMHDAEARAWLRREGLIRSWEGREVVRWGDVLDALPAAPRYATPARATTARRPSTWARGGGL